MSRLFHFVFLLLLLFPICAQWPSFPFRPILSCTYVYVRLLLLLFFLPRIIFSFSSVRVFFLSRVYEGRKGERLVVWCVCVGISCAFYSAAVEARSWFSLLMSASLCIYVCVSMCLRGTKASLFSVHTPPTNPRGNVDGGGDDQQFPPHFLFFPSLSARKQLHDLTHTQKGQVFLKSAFFCSRVSVRRSLLLLQHVFCESPFRALARYKAAIKTLYYNTPFPFGPLPITAEL